MEKLPEAAAYYSVWNGLRDTLEGYYKTGPGSIIRSRSRKNSEHQERDHSGSGTPAAADGAGTDSIRTETFARGRTVFGRNFYRRFCKSDACKRECFVRNFLFCAASI